MNSKLHCLFHLFQYFHVHLLLVFNINNGNICYGFLCFHLFHYSAPNELVIIMPNEACIFNYVMYSHILPLNLLTAITLTVGAFYFSKANNYWVIYILIYNCYT